MEGSAVQAIAELARLAAGDDTLLHVDGEALSTVQLHRPPLAHKPDTPATLMLHSLQGLVDYIAANRDRLTGGECLVHVVSPTSVQVVSGLQVRAVRHVYVDAVASDLWTSKVGRNLSLLDANIALQSLVVDTEDRAAVLGLIGNVREEAEVSVEDDGVTQNVSTRAGVTLRTEAKVPNPVTLAPFRTFREIDQPSSPFVLRIHRGGGSAPTATFHEADGGAWTLEAVEGIAAWLEGKVGDFAVIR